MFIFCSRCKRQAELPPAAARHTLCVVGRRRSGYWRDVSVRYKQTVIGIAWALIRPFLMMVVFTVLRQTCEAALRWYRSLCADGLRRHATVEFFFSALSDTSTTSM
jgi:hypothetical protein